MAHWLLKSEPDDWSWTEQVAKGREGAEWTGIRNFSAQNHLRSMKKGEQAFFYHTGKERAVVGIVKVIAEAHPDSTDSAWRAIDVAAVRPLPTPVGLDQIKANKRLAGMALVRLPRLSVQPGGSSARWAGSTRALPPRVHPRTARGGESERDDVGNAGEGANGTLAHEAPQACLTEVLRPKAALSHEVIVGLLQDDMLQAAIPFAPRRHRRRRVHR